MKVKNDTKLPNKSSRGSHRLILDQFDIVQFRTFRHLLHSIHNKLVDYLLGKDDILTVIWYKSKPNIHTLDYYHMMLGIKLTAIWRHHTAIIVELIGTCNTN